MTDAVVPAGEPLSQVERVVDVFIAPSKTFTDILRSTNWLLPFLIMVVFMVGAAFAIDKKVGFDAVAEQQIAKMPAQAERMEQLPPADRAVQMHARAVGTRYVTYVFFIFVLAIVAIEALVLWGSFNFGLGAQTKYGQVFAVIMFAGMPRLFVSSLTMILLYAGVGIDNFDLNNPVGTNIGYFIQDHPALKVAGSFFDVFGLWSLALLIIGMAIISRKSIGQAATVILGWWILVLLLSTGFTAAFS